MKSLLPNAVELIILAVVAVVSAAFVSRLTPDDGSLALLAFPLLLLSLVMGARRTWKPQEAKEVIPARPDKPRVR